MSNALAKARKRTDPREETFLEKFFLDGDTQADVKGSAIAAGYSDDKAEAVGRRILERFDKLPFAKSLIAAGVTKPMLAIAIRQYIEGGGPDGRQSIKTALAAFGEYEGAGGQSINVMGQGAQILVVVGKTDERMGKLKRGAGLPQLPAKEETSEPAS